MALYVNSILGSDEEVLYCTSLHWIVEVPPILLLVTAFFFWPEMARLSGNQILGILMATIGIIWFMIEYLRQRFEEHVVTNKRVISRWGIIRRDVFINSLESIQSVDVLQGLWARIFDYGTVEIHTAAEAHGVSGRRYIRSPQQWRHHIMEAMDNDSTVKQATSNQDDDDPVQRMQQLEQLFQDQSISEEEYNRKRLEILDEL